MESARSSVPVSGFQSVFWECNNNAIDQSRLDCVSKRVADWNDLFYDTKESVVASRCSDKTRNHLALRNQLLLLELSIESCSRAR